MSVFIAAIIFALFVAQGADATNGRATTSTKSTTTTTTAAPPLDANQYLGRCVVSTQTSTTTSLVQVPIGKYPASKSFSLTGRWCGSVVCFAVAACVSSKPCYVLFPKCQSSLCTSITLRNCDGLSNTFDGNNNGIPDIFESNVVSVSVNGGTRRRRAADDDDDNGNDNGNDSGNADGSLAALDSTDLADATQAVKATITVEAASSVLLTGGSWTNLLKITLDSIKRKCPFGGIKFSAVNAGGKQTYKFYFKPSGNKTICTTPFDVIARKGNGKFKLITGKTTWTNSKFCTFKVRMDDQSPLDQDPALSMFTGEVFLCQPAPTNSTSSTTSTTATTVTQASPSSSSSSSSSSVSTTVTTTTTGTTTTAPPTSTTASTSTTTTTTTAPTTTTTTV